MKQAVEGVIQEWLADGQVVLYRLESASMLTISQWSDLTVETLRAWPKDRPYRAIHDVSKPGVSLLYMTAVQFDIFNVGISPTARQSINEMLAANPGWSLSLAVVVSQSLTGRITKLKSIQALDEIPAARTNVFFKAPAALEWLLSAAQGPKPGAAAAAPALISSTPTPAPSEPSAAPPAAAAPPAPPPSEPLAVPTAPPEASET